MTLGGLIATVLLFVFWTSMTLFNFLQTNKSLDDYILVSGTVDDVQIIDFSGYKNSKRHAIAISLNNSHIRFGFQDKYQNYYNALLNKDIIGKRVTIYYNPTGGFLEDNLTLWIGQLEIENEMFFPLSSNKDYESVGLKIQFIFLCVLTVFLSFTIYSYRGTKQNTSR